MGLLIKNILTSCCNFHCFCLLVLSLKCSRPNGCNIMDLLSLRAGQQAAIAYVGILLNTAFCFLKIFLPNKILRYMFKLLHGGFR